jgi:hypothetical protein
LGINNGIKEGQMSLKNRVRKDGSDKGKENQGQREAESNTKIKKEQAEGHTKKKSG